MATNIETIKAELNGKGRYDFIIFVNGGRECIAHIKSEPALAESVYLPAVKAFVANTTVEAPTKFTAVYDAEGVNIGDWQGEIEWPEEAVETEPVYTV